MSDKFILGADPPLRLTLPFVVVCEGFGDVGFVNALLEHLAINNCLVGCPNKKISGANGKTGFPNYLKALIGASMSASEPLRGIMLLLDADDDPAEAFASSADAWKQAEIEPPSRPFALEARQSLRVASFVLPGRERHGALEHLLLDAAREREDNRAIVDCVERFAACASWLEGWKSNQQAKMRLASLIAVSIQDNPACSPGWIWADKYNPIPADSPRFGEFGTFLREFTAG